MSNLFLLRGLPGAGKTTLAKSIGGIIVEADQYFITENGYVFNKLELGNAHSYCLRQTEALMKVLVDESNYQFYYASRNVIVSNTFTTEKELKPYYELAEKYSYKVFSLIVENRHGGESVHNVPGETVKKMKDRLMNSIKL